MCKTFCVWERNSDVKKVLFFSLITWKKKFCLLLCPNITKVNWSHEPVVQVNVRILQMSISITHLQYTRRINASRKQGQNLSRPIWEFFCLSKFNCFHEQFLAIFRFSAILGVMETQLRVVQQFQQTVCLSTYLLSPWQALWSIFGWSSSFLSPSSWCLNK